MTRPPRGEGRRRLTPRTRFEHAPLVRERLPRDPRSTYSRGVLRAHSIVAVVIVCAASFSSAYAQAPLDVVELTSGGFVRGTVLVYEPGQPVVVQLPNGTTRTFGPSEVARVRVAGAADAPAPAPAPAERPQPPAAAPAEVRALAQRLSQPGAAGASLIVSAPDLVGGEWRMDDGAGDAGAWPDVDPRYRPHGDVHVGFAGGVGVNHVVLDSAFPRRTTTTGARVEVAALLDMRPSGWSPYRFRAEAVLAFMNTDPQTGLLSFFLRLYPLALDLGDSLVLRIGAEIGGRHMDEALGNQLAFFAGPLIEVAVTLLDRRLEIGAMFGFPFLRQTLQAGVTFESTLRGAYLF